MQHVFELPTTEKKTVLYTLPPRHVWARNQFIYYNEDKLAAHNKCKGPIVLT